MTNNANRRNTMNFAKRLRRLIIFAGFCASCATTGTPTTGTPGTVNCASDVAQSAIADAVSRVDTVIASGVAQGAVEATIIRNLEGLAVDLGPQAFACAIQYVSAKFEFDANHASGPVAASKAYESQVARDYLDGHPVLFAH